MDPILFRGLVIREVDFGDHDRYVHVLNDSGQRVEILCRGIRRKGARLAAAVRLFSYAEWQVYESRTGKYVLQSADLITSFWDVTASIEQYTLCCYLAELTAELADGENPAVTRLFLYALRALTVHHRDRAVVKAAFELRLLAESGYAPVIAPCDACGCLPEMGTHAMWFSVEQGTARCGDCLSRVGGRGYIRLTDGCLVAMGHILHSELPRVFHFAVGEEAGRQLARLCEDYVQYHLGRTFHSLKFYHQMEDPLAMFGIVPNTQEEK